MSHATATTLFGPALRRWRTSRRMSQLELATRAETPSRHVSFLETGRSRPSQEMVLRLAAALELPLHERNALLLTAGFPAAFAARHLDDAALGPIRFVIRQILANHAPYPAVVLDRWYDILDANLGGRRTFLGGQTIDPDDPPNLMDLILGPWRTQVVNWNELVWDGVARLRKDVAMAPDDERLADMLARAVAVASTLPAPAEAGSVAPVLFTRIRFAGSELTTLSTLVHFGGSRDVTVDGLHIELVFPADDATDKLLRMVGAEDVPTASNG